MSQTAIAGAQPRYNSRQRHQLPAPIPHAPVKRDPGAIMGHVFHLSPPHSPTAPAHLSATATSAPSTECPARAQNRPVSRANVARGYHGPPGGSAVTRDNSTGPSDCRPRHLHERTISARDPGREFRYHPASIRVREDNARVRSHFHRTVAGEPCPCRAFVQAASASVTICNTIATGPRPYHTIPVCRDRSSGINCSRFASRARRFTLSPPAIACSQSPATTAKLRRSPARPPA